MGEYTNPGLGGFGTSVITIGMLVVLYLTIRYFQKKG